VDEQEMKIIHDRGVHVAHCPSCNMKLASGIAPIYDYLQQGSSVSLGADGAAANDNLNMFQEMRLSALIQKPLHGPTSMPAERVFEMATIGGAKAMGLEQEIGSLEIGKKADVVLIDLKHWHSWPMSAGDVYAQLLYQVHPEDVACTIVDGKIVMQDGEMLTIPAEEVKNKAEASLQRVIKRSGIA
jgi:cytosine/adenosine deaminase-related metal-dependent hydrolase